MEKSMVFSQKYFLVGMIYEMAERDLKKATNKFLKYCDIKF